jgi:tetratricopeptide (TPR) repeat protein
MGADDYFYVVDNLHVHHGLDWATVKWAFTALNMVNWIPLTWLSHAVNYQFFGADPAGHHVVNVVLHILAAVLLFWTLKRATGFLGRSFMVAALFALHPINVEPVVWVAELKTMLSMIFLVLALAAYRWYASKPGIARYCLVALLYSCGLMAKSQILMLPVLLLLWDYWPLQRMWGGGTTEVAGTNSLKPLPARDFVWLVMEKAPLFLLALLDAAVTAKVQGAGRPHNWVYMLPNHIANAVVAYARYIGKALWPQWLGLHYPYAGTHLAAWQIIGASVLLLAITGLVLPALHHRYLAVGWLWFVINLIPMSGLISFGDQAMADRYAYHSFCGLFIMICWGTAEFCQQRHVPVAVTAGVSVAVLAVLTLLTYRQVHYWSDDLTLWSHTLAVSPESAIAEDWVAGDLMARGRTPQALQHYRRAVSLSPTDWVANLQLAFYEHQHGDPQKAIDHYQQVVRASGSSNEVKRQAYINMAHLYSRLGDVEHARQCFEAAEQVPRF